MSVFIDSIILQIIFGAQKLNVIKQRVTDDTRIFTLLYFAHSLKKTQALLTVKKLSF